MVYSKDLNLAQFGFTLKKSTVTLNMAEAISSYKPSHFSATVACLF